MLRQASLFSVIILTGTRKRLVSDIRNVVQEAPLFVPIMPRSGCPCMRITNCGSLGWVTDKERGYRYQPNHPVTEKPWPEMPQSSWSFGAHVLGLDAPPEACLVNFLFH